MANDLRAMGGRGTTERFVALDGLRGIAAIAVVIFHSDHVRESLHLFPPASRYFSSAYLAVDFFFLLSGFVIAAAYERRLEQGLSVGRYMKLRLIRLYPMVLAGGVLGVMSATLKPDPQYGLEQAFAAHLLLVPFFVGIEMFPLNGSQWSLWYELLINALHAATRKALNDIVLWTIVLLGALSLVAANRYFGTLQIGWGTSNWPGGVARVFFSFPAGILIYRMTRRHSLDRVSFPWFAIASILFVVLAWPWGHGLRLSALVIFCFPVLLITAIAAVVPERWARLNTILGDMSYPLYLTHTPLLWLAGAFALQFQQPDTRKLVFWAGVISVVPISIAVHKLYDAPARKWLTRTALA